MSYYSEADYQEALEPPEPEQSSEERIEHLEKRVRELEEQLDELHKEWLEEK